MWDHCGILSKVRFDVICILQKSFRLSLEETEGTRVCTGKPADRLLQKSQQEMTVAWVTVMVEEMQRA